MEWVRSASDARANRVGERDDLLASSRVLAGADPLERLGPVEGHQEHPFGMTPGLAYAEPRQVLGGEGPEEGPLVPVLQALEAAVVGGCSDPEHGVAAGQV
jgi:hypothetical protein